MKVYKTNDNKRAYKLNPNDITMILMIWLGVESCTQISLMLNKSKSTISEQITKLEKAGLIKVVDANEQHFYRKYQVASRCSTLISDIVKERIVAEQ